MKELDSGDECHLLRLRAVRKALERYYEGIEVRHWAPKPPKKVTSATWNEEERTALEKEIEKSREKWVKEERQRWRRYQDNGGWILCQTGTDRADGLSGWPEEREGDGVLTDEERGAKGNRIWDFAFTLHKSGFQLGEIKDLEMEVRRVLDALQRFNVSKRQDREHGIFLKIIASERCTPRIVFHAADREATEARGWNESMVSNLLLLMTAFEREFWVLSSPMDLLWHWPLSHFFVHRAVADMRQQRAQKWDSLMASREEKEASKSKREEEEVSKNERWEKVMELWTRDLKWEDKVVDQAERIGEARKAWWMEITECVVGTLVRDMDAFDKEKRLAIGFEIAEGASSEDRKINGESDGSMTRTEEAEQSEENADLYATQTPGHHPSERSTSPPPPFSYGQVFSIQLPLPRLSPSLGHILLLPYIELLTHILLLANEVNYETVHKNTEDIRETSELDQTPLQTLSALARAVGMREEDVDNWVENIEKVQELASKPRERKMNSQLEQLLKDDRETSDGGLGDAEIPAQPAKVDVFTPLLKYIEERNRQGIKEMPVFSSRYENAGGFLVTPHTKVYALMTKDEKQQTNQRGKKIDRLEK